MSYLHHPLMFKATIRSYFHVHRTARWLQEQRFSPSPLTPRHKGNLCSLAAWSVVRAHNVLGGAEENKAAAPTVVRGSQRWRRARAGGSS